MLIDEKIKHVVECLSQKVKKTEFSQKTSKLYTLYKKIFRHCVNHLTILQLNVS